MTVFTAMLARITGIVQRIEPQRPRHGNETVHWADFIIVLICFFLKRCDSASDWARAREDAEPALNLPKIPRSTLSSKFYDFDPRLAQQVIQERLLQVFPTNPELALIGQLVAGDGSLFRVIGGVFKRVSRECNYNVKLHLDFNLNGMIPVACISDRATADERAAFLTMITGGVTYILDRGSMAFYVLRHGIEHAAFVVMRTYETVVVNTVETFTPPLPTHMQQHWSTISDRLVTSNHQEAQGIVFGLVECTIGQVTARLITNRFDVTTYHILRISAYRWQIELLFRFLKPTRGCRKVITQCPAGIETFCAGMRLTALLQSFFKIDCLAHEGYDVANLTSLAAVALEPPSMHMSNLMGSEPQGHDSALSGETARRLVDETECRAL
ncbi:MAG: transposase [Candidatus Udaeobacter sp.]